MSTRVPGTPRLPILLLGVLAVLTTTPRESLTQNISPGLYDGLTYRHIGPVGNRIAAVAGVSGDPLTYYVGAASGGIWKSEDGGEYWAPVFEGQPDHAVGALAVAQTFRPRDRLGRDRRTAHPIERLTRHGRLQVHRRRRYLATHGTR